MFGRVATQVLPRPRLLTIWNRSSEKPFDYFWPTVVIGGACLFGLFSDKKKWFASEKDPYVFKVVLTGGPCGGKSTAMSHLSERLQSLGYQVFLVPEVATLLITNGVNFGGRSRSEWIELETQIMTLQRQLEDTFENLAKMNDKPTVLLCDRGLCDNRAYMPKEDFDMILDNEGVKLVDIRDKRYDAVFHMVTAAIGAEEFYTTGNNAARSETAAEARALDYKTLEAWLGHPGLRVIDNSSGFKDKVLRAVNGICTAIGAIPKHPERKFVVESFDFPKDLKTEVVNVEMVIFEQDGAQMRALRRTQGSNSTYMLTSSTLSSEQESVVLSRQISGRDYMNYVSNTGRVTKKISYFLWDGRYYALNEYLTPVSNLFTLEVEDAGNTAIEAIIPPFVHISKEVTQDPSYSSEYLAKKE